MKYMYMYFLSIHSTVLLKCFVHVFWGAVAPSEPPPPKDYTVLERSTTAPAPADIVSLLILGNPYSTLMPTTPSFQK